jgi:hypothetical protein
MTDPASAIKRQVDDLIQLQIMALNQSSSLSAPEPAEYHDRHSKISRLVRELGSKQTSARLSRSQKQASSSPSLALSRRTEAPLHHGSQGYGLGVVTCYLATFGAQRNQVVKYRGRVLP